MFEDLNETDLKKIAKIAESVNYKKGDYIFHQNDLRDAFYLIIKGEVDIVKNAHDSLKPIIRIKPKSFLSENALLDDKPHGSSAVCVSAVQLIRFKKDELKSLLKKELAISAHIFPVISTSLAQRLYKMNTRVSVNETRTFSGANRKEKDLMGELQIPDNIYYGVQTYRAKENFNVTGINLSHFPQFIKSLATVKKAAALANHQLGYLDKKICDAITAACDEIISGELIDEFVVDMIQGGAGTSTNMNANEVIANRASEILGHKLGTYVVQPNDHVNLSQSTNDAYPTSIRLAIVSTIHLLKSAMNGIKQAFFDKGEEFKDIIKMGRTQLQDAVPMTLGQEFTAFGETIGEDILRLEEATRLFHEVNLGGTAIGTGINADPEFGKLATQHLAKLTKIPFKLAPNLIEATPDMGAFIVFSSTLKRIAVKLSKICNDLRLLSSGPRAGLNEINLPRMQPGSSIMPGKVNPVIPELMNQIAFQVIGNDLTITLAAEAGQLQLNVMEPVIVLNIFQSLQMLEKGIRTLTDRCIKGITANKEHCESMVLNSIAIVTALNPYIGYANSSMIAKQALETGKSLTDLVLEHKLLSKKKLDKILSPANMIKPQKLSK
ncbi:MAG: aspartate ammonia-lyase [Calditrichaeota bacterium]|nr:aspartate ammonia-lyase [Calditrichota bacterium]